MQLTEGLASRCQLTPYTEDEPVVFEAISAPSSQKGQKSSYWPRSLNACSNSLTSAVPVGPTIHLAISRCGRGMKDMLPTDILPIILRICLVEGI